MLAVTVCLIYVPDHHAATIMQRLCCSGSATGIVFGMYVTDPILNFVCNGCMYCDGILILLLQQAAAAACTHKAAP